MLYRNILISHLFGFILSHGKDFIKVLSDIYLSALDFRSFFKSFFYTIDKMFFINLHFLNHFEYKALIKSEKSIKQVLLTYLLIAVFICDFLAVIKCKC